jgi:hypothetical protein
MMINNGLTAYMRRVGWDAATMIASVLALIGLSGLLGSNGEVVPMTVCTVLLVSAAALLWLTPSPDDVLIQQHVMTRREAIYEVADVVEETLATRQRRRGNTYDGTTHRSLTAQKTLETKPVFIKRPSNVIYLGSDAA